jgi:hypothetical protein
VATAAHDCPACTAARNAIGTTPGVHFGCIGDVRGYTDDAREVLRRTSTAMAGTATIRSNAPGSKRKANTQVGFIAWGGRVRGDRGPRADPTRRSARC